MAKKKARGDAPSPNPPQSPQSPPERPGTPTKLSLENLPRHSNPTLPTLAVDFAEMMLRGDAKGVPVGAMIRFYTLLPEGALEMTRILANVDFVRSLVDMLARTIDYYPTKETASATPKAEPAKGEQGKGM